MKDELVSFETAKLAKEKGFDLDNIFYFYVKPNSKMFGIDEHGRSYPIKSKPKKLYEIGKHATLNSENVYQVPTQSLLQKWLREEYKIYIEIHVGEGKEIAFWNWLIFTHRDTGKGLIWIKSDSNGKMLETYEEALEEGLQEALKLIK